MDIDDDRRDYHHVAREHLEFRLGTELTPLLGFAPHTFARATGHRTSEGRLSNPVQIPPRGVRIDVVEQNDGRRLVERSFRVSGERLQRFQYALAMTAIRYPVVVRRSDFHRTVLACFWFHFAGEHTRGRAAA
jgi:hypothetical protein